MPRRIGAVAWLLWLLAATVVAQPAQKHFLWSVRDAHGGVAHLVGSLHVLTPEFYPLSLELERTFDASKVLVEEVDLDEMNDPTAMLSLIGKAMFSDGRTLEDSVSPATFAEVRRRADQAGLPLLALQRMKPWMAAVALTTPALRAAGFDTELGLDKHFFERAKKAGLERRALETVRYQLDRFDELSPALQEALLTSTMADLDTQTANVRVIAQAWASGDTATIERLMLSSVVDSAVLYQRLLVERNHNWIAHIDTCLQQKAGCFVVVGAAHLVGPDGLPTLLAKKGYAVEQK